MATNIYNMFTEPNVDGLRCTFMNRDDQGQLLEMTEIEASKKIIKALKDRKYLFNKANTKRSEEEMSAASGMISLTEKVVNTTDQSDISSLGSTHWQASVSNEKPRSTGKS